jgi:hypothetical protein
MDLVCLRRQKPRNEPVHRRQYVKPAAVHTKRRPTGVYLDEIMNLRSAFPLNDGRRVPGGDFSPARHQGWANVTFTGLPVGTVNREFGNNLVKLLTFL